MVIQHDQFGDSGIRPHTLNLFGNFGDSIVKQLKGLAVRSIVCNSNLPCIFINHIAPQPLQEPHPADDILGIPGTGFVNRPHAHLVQPESVSTILSAHFVRRDDIFKAFAHFAKLTADFLPLPGIFRYTVHIPFLDFCSRDILPPGIRICICLNVPVIEKLVERFRGIHIPQVKKDFMPEPCIQQMKHRMFHTADIQVYPTGISCCRVMLGTKPVCEFIFINHMRTVMRINITHIVPA